MSTATVNGEKQRHVGAFACPICGGTEDDARGQGKRCWGFTNGEFCHCTREEFAGQLQLNTGSNAFPHKLTGPCKCGTEHAPAEPKPKRAARSKGPGQLVKSYFYSYTSGDCRFKVDRFKTANGGKTFRQSHADGTWPSGQVRWKSGLGGVTPYLYRRPEMLDADPTEPVFFVEGEKDAERLAALGLVATCSPMGAEAPGRKRWEAGCYADDLAGRHVVIVLDNDPPGHEFGELVASNVAPVAASVKVLDLTGNMPTLPERGDVSDWLDLGGTRDELLFLAENIPEWEPSPEPAPSANGSKGGGPKGGKEKTHHEPKIPFTDSGNAARLVEHFGDRIRYCEPYGGYLVNDGPRWVQDRRLAVQEKAKRVPALILAETPPTKNPEVIGMYRDWSLESQSRKRIHDMMTLARSAVSIVPSDLDAHPWLLNVENGTLDLKTGEIRPHDPRDLLTKLAPVAWKGLDAPAPLWEAFLLKIMGENVDAVAFLRRAIGYALTADVGEHALFFLYGTGANGKSTFLNTLLGILGDYACTIRSELLTTKSQEEHPTGLTDLEGRRFVATIEVEDGKRMAESLVKSMTGGDRIRARRMRQDFYEFEPTFKLWLAANHKPQIRGTDEGIWRRIKLIPFTVKIDDAEKVKNYHLRMIEAEGPGILAWAVRGCLEWQREGGLKVPASVVAATDEYRAEMDTLADFLTLCCTRGPTLRCKASDMYAEYRRWCEEGGIKPTSQKAFGTELTNRGIGSDRTRYGIDRTGIRVGSDDADAWLRDYLNRSAGRVRVRDAIREGEAEGFNKWHVFTAAKQLAVEWLDVEDDGKFWELTDPVPY